MVVIEDNCVGCTDAGLVCIGSACPYYPEYAVVYCDRCGATVTDEVFRGRGYDELCEECYDELYGSGSDEGDE